MDEIPFKYSCIITRASGKYDEWDNPVNPTVIYEGKCDYQKGQPTLGTLYVHNDIVFLPKNDVLVRENDIVEAKVGKGRKYKGVVNSVSDIEYQLFERELTKIELKQVMEVVE
jgi:hypothetical protein